MTQEDNEAHLRQQKVESLVGQLMMLSRSEEACRLLGVDGVLVDEVDISVLADPLNYVAEDIAAAIRHADESTMPSKGTMLSTLVAEVRLCGLITSHIDHGELIERVMGHLGEQMV
jgi:hypothetical protein